MAVLYISEFFTTQVDHGRGGSAAQQPPITEQTVAIGGASVASSAFNKNTNLIRVHNDATGPCAIEIGASPTAVAAGGGSPTARMAANTTEYFGVIPGHKIAVISTT